MTGKKTHRDCFTLAAKMEMMATAILCMFWSSWLQSHCITSLAASNLRNKKAENSVKLCSLARLLPLCCKAEIVNIANLSPVERNFL